MVEGKLEALRQRGAVTDEQARELFRYMPRDDSPFPAFGDRVLLVSDAAEALSLLRKQRHALLDVARDPRDPEASLFVLKLTPAEAPRGRPFGRPRTYFLLGVAAGALISALVQMFGASPEPAPTGEAPVILYQQPPKSGQ